jgi:large subunit ribosomal protein L6
MSVVKSCALSGNLWGGESKLSRIGKLPITIPENVEVNLKDHFLTCKGPQGELNRELHPEMKIKVENGEIMVERPSESKNHRSLHGLTRSLIANMVEGVSKGFMRKLEVVGIGYKAEMKGEYLILTLGYSHPIMMAFPETIKTTVPSPNEIIIQGPDKELVGMIASKIRSFRKPEPYKGKGVRYSGEYVRRKAGKTGA